MDLYGSKFNNPMLGVSLNVFSFEDSESKWFIGKEVAAILGYSNPSDALYKKVPDQDKNKIFIENLVISDMQNADVSNNTVNIHSMVTLINEAGVYRLVFGSKLPAAQTFQNWVFYEVLPSIRRDGGYMYASAYEDPIEIENRKDRVLVEALLRRDEELEDIIGKLNYAELMQGTEDATLIGTFAKVLTSNGIKIGRNNLFKWLRIHGYVGPNNEAYQHLVEDGYFKLKPYTIAYPNGETRINYTTLITPKGQEKVLRELQGSNDWEQMENYDAFQKFDYNYYGRVFKAPFIDQNYLGYSDEQVKQMEEDASNYYLMLLQEEKDKL